MYSEILEHLSSSPFRSRFHLGEKERTYIQTKGMKRIREEAVGIIQMRLSPAHPVHDGHQTPMSHHPVFIAQHATAACCRSCLEKWHHISQGRPLTRTQIEFIASLIMAWLEQEMENPVPPKATHTRHKKKEKDGQLLLPF